MVTLKRRHTLCALSGTFALLVSVVCTAPVSASGVPRWRMTEEDEGPCGGGSGRMCEQTSTETCVEWDGPTCKRYNTDTTYKYICLPSDGTSC